MSWIGGRLDERRQARQRADLIAPSLGKVFSDLWEEIKVSVNDAKARGIDISTNGTTWERKVILSRSPLPGESSREPDTLIIRVLKEKFVIAISGPQVNTEFQVDVCEDNVICLKQGGEQVGIHDATVRILDPFLFPDLPRL
ncbi:MAG: hypothetical protein ACHP8B_04605 [Terriglobales bacterium]